MSSQRQAEFTGRHMLAIMLAFFATIIAVNLTMATLAGSSWTGLVVKNSYVASQHFNENAAQARAQAALGNKATLSIGHGRIGYRLADAEGTTIPVEKATLRLHRPVSTREDTTIALDPLADGSVGTAARLPDGVWIMELLAEAGLEHPWRDARRIVIRDGRLQ